jgi:membrane protease YdiL (CAAX protease family)
LSQDTPEYHGWQPPAPPLPEPPSATVPEREPEVPLWAPFAALAAALSIVLLIGGTLLGLLEAADPEFNASDPSVGVTLGLTAFQSVVFVFTAWIAVRLSLGRTPREQFGLNRVRSISEALGWAVLVFVGFLLATYLLSEIFGTPDEQQLVQDVKAEDTLVVLIAYAVTICLIAPVVEEFFFRGFMFTVLARRLGPWWGMLVTGLVFAVGHAPAPAVSLIALGVFGMGLCLLYWQTQSIVPCMALHALNNSITFGVTKELDPALFAAVVVGSVGVVTVVAHALSAPRRTVAA